MYVFEYKPEDNIIYIYKNMKLFTKIGVGEIKLTNQEVLLRSEKFLRDTGVDFNNCEIIITLNTRNVLAKA